MRFGRDSSPAFFDRPRAGRIPNSHFQLRPKNEGARNAGARTTPQVCARCCNKKCTGYPRSAGFPGVPHAVFIGLLRSTPGGQTFQALILATSHLTTAMGPRWRGLYRDKLSPRASSRAPARQADLPRDRAAWTAGRGKPRRISDAPPPATAPRPASEDAAQTPLASGRDGEKISLGWGASQ